MEPLTPTRRRTRSSLGSKGDVTPTPSKENRQPGSGSASKSGRRSAKSPKSPKSDFSALSDDSFHTPPLQERNSLSENLSVSFSTEAESLIGAGSAPAAKRMTADPNVLKELIDDIASAEQRLSSSSASKSPRAAKSPAKSPGRPSSGKKRTSAKKQQERRKTVDGTALNSLLNELDDSVASGADSSVMSALSPANGGSHSTKHKKGQSGNRRHTASPSVLRELMEGGESVAGATEDSNDSLSFTISPDNSPALHVSGTESEANLSLDTSSAAASVAPANLKRRSLNMGRHRDSLSNFMAQLESSDEEAAAASDDEDAQSEKRRKSNSGRTPRRETASPGVLEALVSELQNDRASIEPVALGEKSLGSPNPTVTGTISLTDSSIDGRAQADRSVDDEERRRTASPGMLMALMDDLQNDSQQPQASKRRRSSAFSPSPRRSKRLLNQSPSPVDPLQNLESPKPASQPAAPEDAASDAAVVNTTTDSSGVFAVPTTTNKPPLRGILSSQKKPRPNDGHSVKKSVMFGSPEAAEFAPDEPSMSYTPLQKQVAKSLFPMEPVEPVEEAEEDEETKYNSHVLEEWERLSAASEGDGSPLAVSDDDDDQMVQSTPMSTTSSRRSRRRKSMLQPSAEKLRALRGELDAESEDEHAMLAQQGDADGEESVQPAASPAPQARASFAPSSVSSLASEDRTAKLPGTLADLLREEADKFIGRPSAASSRLSFLSDDDHTAQLPGNLAELLREEGELSVDASGQENTVELEANLAGLLKQAATQVKPNAIEQLAQSEFQPEESAELSGLLVQRGRLSAIAEAAETSASESAQSASSIAHSSRVSIPGSARSARSARSASSLQHSPDRSAFSPARSSLSGYRQSMSPVSAASAAAEEEEAEASFVSEHEKRADDAEDAEDVRELGDRAGVSISMARSPAAPANATASQASLAMLQRLKKLNNESRQASLNVCATPLAGVDPNASRLSISRRLSVMSANAKNNNNRSQLAGNSRRYPSWIPPGADGDSSAELDAGASVLADNTNIVSHGSPEAARQAPQLTFDDALEWALEREDDDSNSADGFVQIFAGFLERALASGDVAARTTAEFFSGKLLEIIPAMVEEMPVDMGAAMESARAAWEAGEQGVAVLKSACTSEAEADRLKQVFDSYHAIVVSDWDSWEYELAGMLESEIADETFKLEDQAQAFGEKLHELSVKHEEIRKAQASQKIREELAAVEAKIAEAHAEIAQLREQLDVVESSKQQLLATKQQALEEIMLLSTRSSSPQDETQLSLQLKQHREMLKEMDSRLSVRQGMGWWRLREHTTSAVRLDLFVLPNVSFRLQFKFDGTQQMNLTGLSVALGTTTGADRWIVGLATALVEDVLKGASGPLSEQKIKASVAERWCDPVPLLKEIDGFIVATRMLVQQLDVLVSSHACAVRIEKRQGAEHLLALEVTKPGCTVTLRLPVKSLLSWDRTLHGVAVDCSVVDGSVEHMQKKVTESLQRLPDKQLDISMPHCPMQEMVRLVKTVMWRA